MPRFVILRHETPPGDPRGTHWDLMLEAEGALRTWALASEPAAGETISADQLADHRLTYLVYEGPISGNRGAVTRCDAGTMEWDEVIDERIVVTLRGATMRGEVRLSRETPGSERWLVSFESPQSADS